MPNTFKLTYEQISTEPAGRQMDAWIAKFVMKWEWIPSITCNYDQWDDNGVHRITWTDIMPARLAVWSPSLNIAAAWDVVEKMSNIYSFNLTNHEIYFNNAWQSGAIFSSGDDVLSSIAETVPLAICRAALYAILKL